MWGRGSTWESLNKCLLNKCPKLQLTNYVSFGQRGPRLSYLQARGDILSRLKIIYLKALKKALCYIRELLKE